MAYLKYQCLLCRRAVPMKGLLLCTLTLSSCAMVLFWAESYPGLYLWSYATNHEQTTARFFTSIELLNQDIYNISVEEKLLHAVDKLPFKVMTPSSLLLEDMYFTPSRHKLVDYNNPVIHQPRLFCSGSELLLILVPSHPEAVAERRAIRETWGSVARGRAWPGKGDSFAVKLLFVLGVAGANFTFGNIQNMTSAENDITIAPTSSNFSGNKEIIFSDLEKKPSAAFITKANNYTINSFNEVPGHVYQQNFDTFPNVLGIGKGYRKVHKDNPKQWGKFNATRFHEKLVKYKREADASALLGAGQKLQTIATTSTAATATTTINGHKLNLSYLTSKAEIMEEIDSFDDIVQFDMVDTYENLTRKIILSLQFSLKICPLVQFILKIDPDIFVNVPLLITFLNHYGEVNSIYGHIYPNSLVERTGKWAVTRTALPISRYPIYAAGNAYVMSTDAANKVVRLAPRFSYVLVEDAFITGILASVGGVNRVNVAGFTKWTESRPDPCDFITDKVYVGNNFTDYNHRVLWREIIDRGRYRCDV